jgi:ssDNA-binding Zn-finger/Zn-ribbon topoisomerase 1
MVYFQCPDCGYWQRSKAEKRVKCHRCGRSYLKRDAKKSEDKSEDVDREKGTGFFKYSRD